MREQAREAPRRYVTRETHLLWGRRHLLVVEETQGRTGVQLDHKRIVLRVRPATMKTNAPTSCTHGTALCCMRPFRA